jgi:murein DD-endopeptidase MepM/ murein hydrolase activator NlpD
VDHDQPDYTVDGTIVLANGLSALASDGQESDLFPAYWSPGLRQYVNYDGHNGYDFDISYQPVLAAAAGTVEYAGWNDPNPYVGYGQMVLINHHNGYVTLYGHLSKLEVSTGDKVSAGQEIGISGTTGHSSGPHLHFSVFHDCQVADPYGWTGKGTDPLQLFSGSRSAYLWLPGQDPLLLNPPPNWPSYPDGLHLAFGGSPKRVGARNVPPADRLLLLSLPSPHGLPPLDSGTALARTEAQVTAEAQSLAPRLDELKARGQLTAYQYIPSAAAVWVRGSASAQRLEDLQGVASLSGVQPHDILAAQAGLAHAVLAQIGRQQAPSLWPVGFRSDLHAWRPVATVLLGEGFVDGLALPGNPVAISLRRGSEIPAAALAAADPTSGGFVGLLHDGAGNIMSVRAGDVVRVTCEGRTTEIAVTPAGLSARRDGISGQTLPGATLALSVLPVGDPRTVHVLTSNEAGRFDAPTGPTLAAGTQIVAGLTDASGNEQAMAAFVPGIAVVEHSSLVHGWAVGKSPRLVLRRASHTLVDTALHPAADGAYSLSLRRAGKPLRLKAGDVLEVGSRLHHRTIRLPKVALAVSGGRMLSIRGPAGLVVTVSVDPPGAPPWTQSATLPPTGSKSLVLPTAASRSGGRASAEMTTPQGDVIAVERTLPAESQR